MRGFLLVNIFLGVLNLQSKANSTPTIKKLSENLGCDLCNPIIIAHRGASGYVPEHTLGSYALAITMNADYIEPDLVMTKDKHLIARHDNELSLTTDVSRKAEFASRYRNQTVDGIEISGWFTEDFTLEEIKSLRAIERIPDIRPGNARMDGTFRIPTFQEIIDLAKSMQISQKRVIGIYPEIKHSTHFSNLGLAMEELVIETLHKNGYHGPNAPIYIQSFEVNNLKKLKTLTSLRLLQLYESNKSLQPFDQAEAATNLTYGEMSTPQGLLEVATYAHAVGPDKSYIIPRDVNNKLGTQTSFVEDAHEAGLKVHPYTFRAENAFLPVDCQSEDRSPEAIGDFTKEIRMYLATGIDGLFSDQPDIPAQIRGPCVKS